MELIDKLKDEFPTLDEDILLKFIEEAREEVLNQEEKEMGYENE